MRERKTGRLLALLLVAALLLSLLPATVLAVDTDAVTTRNNGIMRIVHLDCGRKYFTVEWVERLIDEMAKNDYTHLELAFGNDGLRFLLDDMSVTVNEKEYFGNEVTNAIKQGNAAYTNASSGEWTEDEMDSIISYAKAKKISIIPLLNTPGHMDAIVCAMNQLGISNAAFNPNGTASVRTVSLTSDDAVAFTQALVKKYVDYFAGQGCKYFNLGADEYGNDVLTSGGMGFGYLVDHDQYGTFVNYVNTLADYVTDKSMTPIVFNDGVCYNNKTTSGLIDTNVLVSYWSCGWSGYDVASASFLRGQGYSLINTHGDFYYVLKSEPDMWHNSTDNAEDAKKWNNNTFAAKNGQNPYISDPVGSMFCIWCDKPGEESEATIAQNVINGGILSYMASAMKGEQINPPTEENPDYTNKVTISLAEGETKSIYVQGDDLSGKTYSPYPTGYVNVNVTYTPGEMITADGNWERVTEGVAGIVSGQEYLIIANEASDGKDGGHILTTTGDTASISANQGDTIPDSAVDDTYKFVITQTNGGYTLKGSSGYLYPDGNIARRKIEDSKKTGEAVTITEYNNSDTFKFKRDVGNVVPTTSCLNWDGHRINASENGHPFFLYRYVPGATTEEPGTNTITFTGLKEGDASVVIGDTKYNITVLAKELSNVDPLKVEYWITNSRTSEDNGNTFKNINATDPGVYSSDGIELATLLPEYTNKDGRQVLYWQSRLLDKTNRNSGGDGTEEQTTESGDDETFSGSQITKVRYWQGTWSVFTEDNVWVNVASKHQLVAYYLEILPVSDELFVTAADWGHKGDGSTTGYLETDNCVTISVQVVYEDGKTNPANTTANALRSRTMVYNYWDPQRGIGTFNFNGQEDYQIYRITAETGKQEGYGRPGNDATYTVTKFSWNNNAMDVYNGEPVDSYVVHNKAGAPSNDGFYDNLTWDEAGDAILIKVYVRAVEKEDSLKVHYVDASNNEEFYSYSITVKEGTYFNENIQLDNPWKGDLVNGTVTNINNVPQTVTADLAEMPQISAQYRYSSYECNKVERRENGKEVFLYYTFKNSHSYVIDFGLPLEVQLNIEGNWTSSTVANAQYGNVSFNDSTRTLTYTPTSVLETSERLTLSLQPESGDPVVHYIYIYPASNVLYEETFLTVDTVKGTDGTDWTVVNERGSEPLPVQSNDQKALYGFDSAYADNALRSSTNSMKTSWKINFEKGQYSKYLTTSFYGNAFDLIGTAGPDTGYVYIYLEGEQNTIVIIDTSYVDGKETTLYQVPLAHVELTEGEYTAYIRAAYRAASGGSSAAASRSAASTFSLMSASSPLDEVYEVLAEFERDGFVIDDIEFVSVDENSVLSESADAQVSLFSMPDSSNDVSTQSVDERPAGTTVTIDGFRVYRKAIDSDFAAAYAQAKENEFRYVNILGALENQDLTEIAYVEGDAKGYRPSTYEASGGPQNELYLRPNKAITIKFEGEGTAQFSARMVGSGYSTVGVVQGNDSIAYHQIGSNTEMYYSVGCTGTVTISNTSTGMLALGNLKMTGDVTLSVLSEEDVQAACLMLASAFPVDPGETEEPEEPVEPETPAVFEPGKLDVKVKSTNILFNKLVTVTVSASADVDKLTINGKTLYPTNSLLVKWGLSKTYTYIYVDTVKRSESKSYEIVAYNDAGLASAPVTVQG